MIVLGIDPGKHGALAWFDDVEGRLLDIVDMPIFKRTFGKGKSAKVRDEIDIVELERLIAREPTPDLAVLELVAERPAIFVGGKARAPSGQLQLGIAWGYVRMLLSVFRIQYEGPTPAIWKRELKVPADKIEACQRADQILPAQRDLWRGPRGGLLDGRAEAMMLAYWGARNCCQKSI